MLTLLVVGLLPVQQRDFDTRFPEHRVTHISSQQQHRLNGGHYDYVVLCTAFVDHKQCIIHARQGDKLIRVNTRGVSGIARDVRAALVAA